MSKKYKRRNHAAAFKKEVVLATFKGEKSIQQFAVECEIHSDLGEQVEGSGAQVA